MANLGHVDEDNIRGLEDKTYGELCQMAVDECD